MLLPWSAFQPKYLPAQIDEVKAILVALSIYTARIIYINMRYINKASENV